MSPFKEPAREENLKITEAQKKIIIGEITNTMLKLESTKQYADLLKKNGIKIVFGYSERYGEGSGKMRLAEYVIADKKIIIDETTANIIMKELTDGGFSVDKNLPRCLIPIVAHELEHARINLLFGKIPRFIEEEMMAHLAEARASLDVLNLSSDSFKAYTLSIESVLAGYFLTSNGYTIMMAIETLSPQYNSMARLLTENPKGQIDNLRKNDPVQYRILEKTLADEGKVKSLKEFYTTSFQNLFSERDRIMRELTSSKNGRNVLETIAIGNVHYVNWALPQLENEEMSSPTAGTTYSVMLALGSAESIATVIDRQNAPFLVEARKSTYARFVRHCVKYTAFLQSYETTKPNVPSFVNITRFFALKAGMTEKEFDALLKESGI